MNVKNIEEKIKNIKIKKEWKIAFFSAIIIGLIAHSYIFLNNFPNHDGLYNIYDDQDCSYLGRIFLQWACLPSSYYTLPSVIGVLSITYISITSVILVELFQVKKKINIILISGILILFPTVASSFSYLFTMDGYMLALLLASASVLFTYKYKYGWLLGAIALCLSIGIYQAYLSFAIVLCMIKILFSFINKENEVYKKIIKDIFMLCLGFILYYICLQIILKVQNIELSDYQGANSLGSLNLSNILAGIVHTYKSFFAFFIKAPIFRNNMIIIVLNLIIFGFIIGIYIKEYIKNKLYKNIKITGLIILIVLAMPIAFYIIRVISSDTIYHWLMVYTWCLPYIALVVMFEKFSTIQTIRWIATMCIIFMLFNFYVLSNILYFNVEQKFEKTYSLGIRLVDRIEQCDEYYTGMHVAFIGEISDDYYPPTSLTSEYTITGTEGNFIYFDPYHYESFFRNYFNFTITSATEQEKIELQNTDEFINMKQWPNKDSVKVINNILVVKY